MKTPAFADVQAGMKMLSELPKLEDIFKAPTKEELIKVLENYLYPKPNTDFVNKAIGNSGVGDIVPTFTPANGSAISQSYATSENQTSTVQSSNVFTGNPISNQESPQVSNAMLEFERLLNSKHN